MYSSLRKILISVSVLLVISGQVFGTTIAEMHAHDLIDSAEVIFVGTVLRKQEEIVDGLPYTFFILDVERELKGSLGDAPIRLRVYGGPIPGRGGTYVHGAPYLSIGTKYLLFSRAVRGKRHMPIVGWTQGMFRFAVDDETEREILVDADGNEVLGIAKKDWVLLPPKMYSGDSIEEPEIEFDDQGGEMVLTPEYLAFEYRNKVLSEYRQKWALGASSALSDVATAIEVREAADEFQSGRHLVSRDFGRSATDEK